MKPQPLQNPPNPWHTSEVEYLEEPPLSRPEPYEDFTKEIIAQNDSPDVSFRFSVNPYRGCMHACAYCYARPSHEYLGFGAGTDFDTKVAVKLRAAELLRRAFERPSWTGETLVFSGVTDCYQPLEASLRLTRQCLEVCAEYRNPVGIITKGPLVERDLDVLKRLNDEARISVTLSIPFWRPEMARAIEPGVATPKRRMQTVAALASAGIPVGVSVAPVIPGLEDDMVTILKQAAEARAQWAGFVLLRLPGSVKEVFETRLRTALPLHAEKVMNRIRETRGGKLYDSRFGHRHVGEGKYSDSICSLFSATCLKLGLNRSHPYQNPPGTFRRPLKESPQLALF